MWCNISVVGVSGQEEAPQNFGFAILSQNASMGSLTIESDGTWRGTSGEPDFTRQEN
jgi:hypothetical protein